MKLSLFDFDLPVHLIADRPAGVRDASKLLVVPRDGGPFRHLTFHDLPSLLRPGDLLVVNDTKVLPARLVGTRKETGGKVEVLLLESQNGGGTWTCLVAPGRKGPPGTVLEFSEGLSATVIDRGPEGSRVLQFDPVPDLAERLARAGLPPLPPYILARRHAIESGEESGHGGRSLRGKVSLHHDEDRERYQTVYAREPGSIAGPTAGLHFTDELLARLDAIGVERATVTLHVGLATFRPIRTDEVESHTMLSERFRLPAETVAAVERCRARGGRVIAVGTTSVRVLEAVAAGTYEQAPGGTSAEAVGDPPAKAKPGLRPAEGRTNLFVTPGFSFQVIDGMVTNFHLPRSSLLLLVSALAGRERILAAYREAISTSYRFYSYGDAMVIL